MADPGQDPLKIYPDAEHPSLIVMMGGGVPSRNPDFAKYAQENNRNVDLDEAAFNTSLAQSKNLPGAPGHYDEKGATPPSPVRLGTEIQSDLHSVQPSKVTDINSISLHGNIVGFVYRTENGHMALQAAVPDGTTSHTNTSSWQASAGYSKEGASAGVNYGQSYSTTTTFPTRGDVVPLTQLTQLPSNSVVQPLNGTNSRQLLSLEPHQHQDQFRLDNARPEPYNYDFSHAYSLSQRDGVDKALGVSAGESVTLFNGRNGLEQLAQRESQQRVAGRT
jgi:hypothetical protein